MLFKKKILQFNLYIFFFILVLILIQFSTNKAEAKTYKVKNIEIVEAYDVDFDKIEVIDKAFKKAFIHLIYQATSSDDKNALNDISLKKIKSLIESFSIVDEKFIENNYMAKVEVNFDKKGILRLFESKNVISSIPIEKNIILLPILIDIENDQISLFSENSFYNFWNNKKDKHSLLQYILPNEDLEDLKLLQSKIEKIEDYEFFEIISKYNIEDYIIAIIFKNQKKVKVLSKVNLNNQLSILNKVFEDVDLDDLNTIEKITKDLKLSYENYWKKLNQINTSIKLSLALSINSNNIDLINKFEQKLSELDLVSKYNIDNFSSDNTVYKIMYNSTPDRFITEFRSSGFEIDTSYGVWKIK